MPRKPQFPPPIRQHASGQAYIRWHGRFHYLGPFGSDEVPPRYARLIAEIATGLEPIQDDEERTVSEILAAYLPEAEAKGGNEAVKFKNSMRALGRLYGASIANSFTARDLAAFRSALITGTWMTEEDAKRYRKAGHERGVSAVQAMRSTRNIVNVFRWAESQGLVRQGLWHHLQSLPPLSLRNEPREDVEPVAWEVVEKTLPHLPAVMAAAVRVGWWTGLRPGELLGMRVADLVDEGGETITFRLEHHKTARRTGAHRITLGPRAAEIVRAMILVSGGRDAKGKPIGSPWVFPSPLDRTKAITRGSFSQMVKRAAKAAGVEHWHPYQLRHACKARLEKEHGPQAARAVLRHRSLMTTSRYAATPDEEFAARVAKEAG